MAPTHAQTLIALAALREVLAIEGLTVAERTMLRQVEHIARVGHTTVLTAIRPRELAAVFESPEERRRLVRLLVLGALADGRVSGRELAWVRQVASAVRVDDVSIEVLSALRCEAYADARARLLSAPVHELVREGWALGGATGAVGVGAVWALLAAARWLQRLGLPPVRVIPPTGEVLSCLRPWLRRMIDAPEPGRLMPA
ncbi:MAG: hypothetical protein ACI8PZ_007453 [Myxococcota bacterium]|jgi:hypothetical protein